MTSTPAPSEEPLGLVARHAFEHGARDGVLLGLVVPAAVAIVDYLWRRFRG